MFRKRQEFSVFNLSMLDVLACALGAFLILVASAGQQAAEPEERREAVAAEDYTSGFTYPKEMVLLLDMSGSMGEDDGRKWEALKAGLKLMIATLSEEQKVALVTFPWSGEKEHIAPSEELKPMTQANKEALTKLLDDLKPDGTSPTKQALEYVLNSAAYMSAKGIVLLSDGEPRVADPVDPTKDWPDDIEQILSDLAPHVGKMEIHTIGIGLEKGSVAEQFMTRLSAMFEGTHFSY